MNQIIEKRFGVWIGEEGDLLRQDNRAIAMTRTKAERKADYLCGEGLHALVTPLVIIPAIKRADRVNMFREAWAAFGKRPFTRTAGVFLAVLGAFILVVLAALTIKF